jgi:hypothetical protein
MTRCQECGYDWDSRPEDVVVVIRELPVELSRLFRTVDVADGDIRLRTRPAREVWSPLEYIGHTGDAIAWYGQRVARVLTEHRPALEPLDWDAHTVRQRYHDRHLDDVLDAVEHTCARFVSMLTDLRAGDWQRDGIGSDGQPRTVTNLATRAGHEAQHHLHDVRAGLSPAE